MFLFLNVLEIGANVWLLTSFEDHTKVSVLSTPVEFGASFLILNVNWDWYQYRGMFEKGFHALLNSKIIADLLPGGVPVNH